MYKTPTLLALASLFFVTNVMADTPPALPKRSPAEKIQLMCPTDVTIEDIKTLKSTGTVRLKTGIRKDLGAVESTVMDFTAGNGVDAIHTHLPISKAKFTASKTLNEAVQEGNSMTCKYSYDKTFGRTGAFEIKTEVHH